MTHQNAETADSQCEIRCFNNELLQGCLGGLGHGIAALLSGAMDGGRANSQCNADASALGGRDACNCNWRLWCWLNHTAAVQVVAATNDRGSAAGGQPGSEVVGGIVIKQGVDQEFQLLQRYGLVTSVGGVAEEIAGVGVEAEGNGHPTTQTPQKVAKLTHRPNPPACNRSREGQFKLNRTRHQSVRSTPGSYSALPYCLRMIKAKIIPYCRRTRTGLSALTGLALCLHAPLVEAQNFLDGQTTETGVEQGQKKPLPLEQRAQINYDAYILGPGDGLRIELLDLPELSGIFSIGPDGTLYLPRLQALYVEGLTVEELRTFLTQQFSTYVRDPQVYVRPVVYRPIRVYVGGEVQRPGYYTLSGESKLSNLTESAEKLQLQAGTATDATRPGIGQLPGGASSSGLSTFGAVFPTVFDAIRSAQGITPYTDLSKVQVIRKRAEGLGGGKIRTNLNFLSLITEGNESQNIRLFDGDILNVAKSSIALKEQLLKAGQSNLSPQFIEVFVTGRVNIPGAVKIPQGGTLNQAISLAGGPKLLKGKIEFVRFNREGTIDRRVFSHKPAAALDAPNNPILAAGDLIRINESIVSGSVSVLNELTTPFIGLYSFYSLFKRL